MKKLISMLIATLVAMGTLLGTVGCSSGGEPVDESKTQFYVNVLDIGVGVTFMETLKEKFEEKYKNEHFEDGKTGVQIHISQRGVEGSSIQGALASPDVDVYYTSNFSLSQLVVLSDKSSEYLEDITDIVTEGGEDSIHSRLFDSARSYYNIGTDAAPKYYALPWFSSYFGTVYDVGLFKEKHFYSTDPDSEVVYAGLDGIYGENPATGECDDDWGPDGRPGTFDDGLPATWADFDELTTVMSNKGVTPFVFTNQDGYTTSWLQSVWVSYEGKSNYEILKTYDGTYKYTDASGQVSELTITQDNGYLISEQEGKKAAISIAKKILSEGLYEKQSFNSGTDNEKAQRLFLGSKPGAISGVQSIAFLMEGTWWEKESEEYFAELARKFGSQYAYGTREFGYFPLPRFTDTEDSFVSPQVNDKITLRGSSLTQSSSAVFINKKSDQKELAKLFLKFAYSDEMNAQFTVDSGVSKPMAYQMSEDDLAKITPYQRSIYELAQSDSVEVVFGESNNEILLRNSQTIDDMTKFKRSGSVTSNVFDAFRNSPSMTCQDYWQGVLSVGYADIWEDILDNLQKS